MQQRVGILESTKALLVSYAGLILQMPDMFPQIDADTSKLGPEQLVPRLLAGIDNTNGLPAEFIEEMAGRFANDGLETVRLLNMNHEVIRVLRTITIRFWVSH